MQKLRKQLKDSNTEVRRQAVEKLNGMKDRSCIPLLLEAMKDASWRVRKSAVDILFQDYTPDEYIDGLLQLLSIEDNAGARNSAIEALIRLGKRATEHLIAAFRTPNKDVRKFIIDVLGELKDSRSLGLMLEAIRDEDENVRATAVEHLGKVGEASVVDALIAILDSGDLWTAYPAANALGRIGDKKALPHLLQALKKKPLREPVLKALGLLAEPSTLEPVIALLEDGPKSIREQALRTIEKMYHNGVDAGHITAELRRILGDEAIGQLVKFAWSNKREVRISAILLLGLMKDEAAYGPLLDISHEEEFAEDVKKALIFIGRENPESLLKLFSTDNPHQLRFICGVAGEITSPMYYDTLLGLLNDDDGHVRAIAARGVSKIGDGKAKERLIQLLTDPYEDVQEAAVEALHNLKSALNMNELSDMLKAESHFLRRNAARLLGKMKAGDAVAGLGFALKDEKIMVRKAVVEALSLIGTPEAVRYLTYALTDEDPDVRISATLSLGAIGGEGILDSLIILTADQNSFVRVSAAKALGLLKDRRAVSTLISLLTDRNGFVVTTAIESLKALGSDEAREAVLNMLSSDDEEIKRTAIAALEGFADVEERLIPFLKDPDWASRIAAVRVLGRSRRGRAREEIEKMLDTEEDPTVMKVIEEILGV